MTEDQFMQLLRELSNVGFQLSRIADSLEASHNLAVESKPVVGGSEWIAKEARQDLKF